MLPLSRSGSGATQSTNSTRRLLRRDAAAADAADAAAADAADAAAAEAAVADATVAPVEGITAAALNCCCRALLHREWS